ncbi:MAG: hypothetical protein AAGI53_09455 [Planctomycetota bacterium]
MERFEAGDRLSAVRLNELLEHVRKLEDRIRRLENGRVRIRRCVVESVQASGGSQPRASSVSYGVRLVRGPLVDVDWSMRVTPLVVTGDEPIVPATVGSRGLAVTFPTGDDGVLLQTFETVYWLFGEHRGVRTCPEG